MGFGMSVFSFQDFGARGMRLRAGKARSVRASGLRFRNSVAEQIGFQFWAASCLQGSDYGKVNPEPLNFKPQAEESRRSKWLL